MIRRTQKPIKEMSPDELRDYKAEKERDRRARIKKEKEEDAKPEPQYREAIKASEKAAKAIIADAWGISRSMVIDSVFTWGQRAAEKLKIKADDNFWANGPKPSEKLVTTSNVVLGEITYERELYALYQFVEAWREDAISTFDEYLIERRTVKTGGTINRGKYFGLYFPDEIYKRWDEFDVQWNADDLRPDYNRNDVRVWLGKRSPIKKRLKIAARNTGKSTWSFLSLIAAILCCPDIRLLFVTETNPLALEFFGAFAKYFQVTDPSAPSRFNRLFPEYCVPAGDISSLKFRSPMSILGLPQPSCKTSSMMSGGWAGNRADYILLSDAISNNTVGTEDQIQKSISLVSAISELVEIGGYMFFEGTPWSEFDMYRSLLDRNERSGGKNLLYVIHPAWRTLPSGEGKAVHELEESDVELLFPTRLTWEVLQTKLSNDDPPYRDFRMQSLCQFLPQVEEAVKLHFREDEITRNKVDYLLVPSDDGFLCASSDLAWSKSRYADLTCFTIMKVTPEKLFVLEQKSGHLNDAEKAATIVEMYRRYPGLRTWAIEKYPNNEHLERAIIEEGRKYGVEVPIRWDPVKTTPDAKFHRLRSIQSLIEQNVIKFVTNAPGANSSWLSDLITELLTLDNTTTSRRSTTRKDDRGDSLALGIQRFAPAMPNSEEARIREEEEKTRREKVFRDIQYFQAFGSRPMGQGHEPYQAECDAAFAAKIAGNYTSQQTQDSPVYQSLRKAGLVKDEGEWKPSGLGWGSIRR